MICRIWETMRGIRPSVGSSSRMILGSSIIARAMASICCSPPESVPPAWSRRCARTGKYSKTLSRSCCLRLSVTPARSRPVRRFSITVSSRNLRRSLGQQFAVVKHGDAIGELHHHFHVVLDDEDGEVLADAAHELHRVARLRGTHAGGWLIEAEERGLGRERDADLEIALLAVR